jgi:hypothetical protein
MTPEVKGGVAPGLEPVRDAFAEVLAADPAMSGAQVLRKVRGPSAGIEAYNRWNVEVEERLPVGRLLVYEVK